MKQNRILVALACALALTTFGAMTSRAQTIYAVTSNYTHDYFLTTIDVSTGLYKHIASLPTLYALTFGSDGTLYGTTGGGPVYAINPLTGSYVGSGNLGSYTALGLAPTGSPSQLLSINGFGQLMTIDIATAKDTTFGPGLYPPSQPDTGALFYGPGGALYSMVYAESANGGDDSSRLYERDPLTGAATLISHYSQSVAFVDGMVYAAGHIYGFGGGFGTDEIYDFTSGAAVDTGIQFAGASVNERVVAAAWESGSSMADTPEPGSFALFTAAAVGSLGLAARKRRNLLLRK